MLLSAINCFGRIDYRIIVEKCPHFDNSILFLFSSMAYVINYDHHDGHHPPCSISSNIRTERFILHYWSTSSSTVFVHPFTSVFLASVVRSLVVYSVFHVFLRSFIYWLVVCESLLVTSHFSLLARFLDYLLLVTRFLFCFKILLATSCLLHVTCHALLASYLLRVTFVFNCCCLYHRLLLVPLLVDISHHPWMNVSVRLTFLLAEKL